MISNTRTEEFARGSRLNFDILCDVCGEQAVRGENGKVYCFNHKKNILTEPEVKKTIEKNYENGITVGERNMIEKIKTMESDTKDLPEARLFSKALGNFLSKLK